MPRDLKKSGVYAHFELVEDGNFFECQCINKKGNDEEEMGEICKVRLSALQLAKPSASQSTPTRTGNLKRHFCTR